MIINLFYKFTMSKKKNIIDPCVSSKIGIATGGTIQLNECL